jgi:hypothetical protein
MVLVVRIMMEVSEIVGMDNLEGACNRLDYALILRLHISLHLHFIKILFNVDEWLSSVVRVVCLITPILRWGSIAAPCYRRTYGPSADPISLARPGK